MSGYGPKRAWSYALYLLGRRSHTEAEIRERLSRKQAEREVIDDIIERLTRYRLVDDAAFAEAYVRTHRRRKGSIALRHELRRKGVPEAMSESALAPLSEPAQLTSASDLLERNAWRFRTPRPERNRARAFAFLARRGFPTETVAGALERADWLSPAEPA
ncbi:MAG: regulatory protein RecX [Trueperaceae bacterium]